VVVGSYGSPNSLLIPRVTASAMRFGQATESGLLWSFRRNCAMKPSQLLAVLAFLSAVSLGVASAFWWQGAVFVMPFALIEVSMLAVAFFAYARHATDSETARLDANWLVIEQEIGGKRVETRFPRASVRIEPLADSGNLIEVTARGDRLEFGRHVRADWRPLVAREMRFAVRGF
jgi:uncharacterized membrane protein